MRYACPLYPRGPSAYSPPLYHQPPVWPPNVSVADVSPMPLAASVAALSSFLIVPVAVASPSVAPTGFLNVTVKVSSGSRRPVVAQGNQHRLRVRAVCREGHRLQHGPEVGPAPGRPARRCDFDRHLLAARLRQR